MNLLKCFILVLLLMIIIKIIYDEKINKEYYDNVTKIKFDSVMQNINDVVGNKNAISKIDEWLSKFDKHNNNSIIISGSHGIGKTLVIDILLKKYNYTSKVIYPDELKNFRNNTDVDFEDYYNSSKKYTLF